MGTMAYRLVGPNSQATAQKHDRCPICLSVNALTRYNTEGADWSRGLVRLASPAVLWVGVST